MGSPTFIASCHHQFLSSEKCISLYSIYYIVHSTATRNGLGVGIDLLFLKASFCILP